MTKLGGWKSICALLVLCTATAISSLAQTYGTLYSFNSTDGNDPLGALVQGLDGNFYGSTHFGGAFNRGTIFKISPGGTLTTLHSFCAQSSCPDGSEGGAPLALGTDGNFYGTTSSGGANGYGTVFKITGAGALTTLYSFCAQVNCADGNGPIGGLVQGFDGDLYGTTYAGGVGDLGTVFKITRAGALTTLYSFCPFGFSCTDGIAPFAGLVQGTDGNFYGTTSASGSRSGGTVFKITPRGILTTLYSFCALANCADGYNPFEAALVQGTDGNFYGTTSAGGVNSGGLGTVFKITPRGALTTLYSFCALNNCTDGITPYTGVVQGTDGNFYGTTTSGGSDLVSGYGTVFEITGTGTLTTLYSFCPLGFSCTDATSPDAGLVQGTNGTFYGTATSGGAHNDGTVFSLAAVGLGPFVETRPTSGKEGAKIRVLGQGFSNSSVVKFGGTQATTIVLSGTTSITATVPAWALTGAVTVTTGTTTLTSSQKFRVLPTIASFSPASGPVGTSVGINGTGLMQATRVAFNGTSASFTVNSDILITATLPTGATTGKIAVTTKGGNAASATVFTVN